MFANSFTVAGFSKYSHILFRVRAQNEDGWGPWSKIGGPYPSTDYIWTTNATARTITVHWRDFPSIVTSEWEIQQRVHTGPAHDEEYSTVAFVNSKPFMSKVCENLRPGALYMFRVRPKDRYGWRPWISGMVSEAIRTASCVPDPPEKPWCSQAESTATSVVICWIHGWFNGAPIEEFQLQILRDGKNWESCGGQMMNALEKRHQVTDLRAGCEYFFRIRVRNKLGWSHFSECSEPIKTNSLEPPTNLHIQKCGVNWLEVAWDPPSRNMLIERYELQSRSAGADGHGNLYPWKAEVSPRSIIYFFFYTS